MKTKFIVILFYIVFIVKLNLYLIEFLCKNHNQKIFINYIKFKFNFNSIYSTVFKKNF